MGIGPVEGELYGNDEKAGAPVVKFYLGRVYMDPIERKHAIEAGRIGPEDQDYHETDFVRISYPGNRFMVFDQPIKREASGMDPDDRAHPDRFPREWDAYQNRMDGPIGTPLSAIQSLNASDIKHLDHYDILTVENLAGLSDIAVLTIGNGIGRYRDLAQSWLRANVKPVLDVAAQSEIDALKATVAQLMEMVTASAPAKRGRPAKIEDTDNAITE